MAGVIPTYLPTGNRQNKGFRAGLLLGGKPMVHKVLISGGGVLKGGSRLTCNDTANHPPMRCKKCGWSKLGCPHLP